MKPDKKTATQLSQQPKTQKRLQSLSHKLQV